MQEYWNGLPFPSPADLPDPGTEPRSLGGGSNGKEYTFNAEDPGSILGSGRSPGEGNGYPFQYSYLENFMDRGTWQAGGHKELIMTEWLMLQK